MREAYLCGHGRTADSIGCRFPVAAWPEGQTCAAGHAFSMANVLAYCTFRVASEETAVFEYRGRPMLIAQLPDMELCDVEYFQETPILPGVDLAWADFSAFELCGVLDLTAAVLAGANFSEKDMGYAVMRRACLVGAKFAGARADYLFCDQADLTKADLSGFSVSHAATFAGANLCGANLSGAYLALADFTDAVLEDVQLDGDTLLPPGHEIVDGRLCSSTWILD